MAIGEKLRNFVVQASKEYFQAKSPLLAMTVFGLLAWTSAFTASEIAPRIRQAIKDKVK
jgi:hypothetical protein